jgi:hypothetical protein
MESGGRRDVRIRLELIFSVSLHGPAALHRDMQRMFLLAEAEFVNLLRSPGIDSQPGGPVQQSYLTPEPVFVDLLRSPGIDSPTGGPVRLSFLTYWPARLHRLVESIPGLVKSLQIQAQDSIDTCIFINSVGIFADKVGPLTNFPQIKSISSFGLLKNNLNLILLSPSLECHL